MNRIEARLRDAFGAAAHTVRPESVVGLADQTRSVRARRLVPLMAAAAVAVVIVGASVITPLALAGGHGAPARPAGPAATSPAASASPSAAVVTTVPDVVDMMVNPATALLQGAGLQVMIVKQASSAFPPGCVLAQTPAAGTLSPTGATVVLTIAAAPISSAP